jgi:homoserine dehydrogenase
MAHYNLALLGFGNVGRALARLLLKKRHDLQNDYQITFSVTGIATGRHGMAVDLEGFDLEEALAVFERDVSPRRSLDDLSKIELDGDMDGFIAACRGNVLFENTPVNYATGEPAAGYLKSALEAGMHAITANKGPVVHAYRELTDLALSRGLRFYFESTVMDGAPIFSLFRETLPGARLLSFKGILNSTTNLILKRMEEGESFDQAVAYAQSIGIAETDPSGDVDGWDASVKVAALVTVLMGVPLKPDQVDRQGIRGIQPEDIERALQEGKRWKLLCTAQKLDDGIRARVAPELVPNTSPLYSVSGTTSTVQFETDVLGLLSIVETDPGPETTAYGLLADFLNIARHAGEH